ncbi:MAG: hypothetical protein UT11_C0063G0007 [Berkelbacteria bacterium GW2011_GWA2_38_9]|uniref:Uncharacterized protein n=1 Tax=Berkelbacteria bacterium GW2011_GWA2_38_9 TaxID=1618334 RepID=A0A0G0L6W7_9BACT|nr:MAG: hypothetical protein UT11_C0063G0007 [Berkelbacteria bacterium GW2011_GWA2_38_9]
MSPQVLNKPIPVQYHDGNLKILIKLPLKNGEKFNIEIIKPQKKSHLANFEKIAKETYGIWKDDDNKARKKTTKKKGFGIGGLKAISELGITGGPKNLSSIIDEVLYGR